MGGATGIGEGSLGQARGNEDEGGKGMRTWLGIGIRTNSEEGRGGMRMGMGVGVGPSSPTQDTC